MRTEDKISPLSPTKEILEKNGWELHDDVFINKDENISNIIFSTSGKFIMGGVFVIEYVHQLQQYLRLDGDIEFANNLKVQSMDDYIIQITLGIIVILWSYYTLRIALICIKIM